MERRRAPNMETGSMSLPEAVEILCDIISSESDVVDELFLMLLQHVEANEIDENLLIKMQDCAKARDSILHDT